MLRVSVPVSRGGTARVRQIPWYTKMGTSHTSEMMLDSISGIRPRCFIGRWRYFGDVVSFTFAAAVWLPR